MKNGKPADSVKLEQDAAHDAAPDTCQTRLTDATTTGKNGETEHPSLARNACCKIRNIRAKTKIFSRRLKQEVLKKARRGPLRHPGKWLAAGLLLALLALSMPHAYIFYLGLRFPVADLTYRANRDFLVLAFGCDNSGNDSGGTSALRFREHIEALQQAGYQFIGLKDIHALFEKNMLLPHQSVLLTVDARDMASAWSAWEQAVIRSHARAVVFVDDEKPQRPNWKTLRRTAATPHWEIAAAYENFSPATPTAIKDAATPGNMQKTALHYGRLHDLEKAALLRHRRFLAAMQRPFPEKIMALAYPDRRNDDVPDKVADCDVLRHILAEQASLFYDLAFIKGELALNSNRSDPLRLNRLHVPGAWTGQELIARLKNYRAMPFETADRTGKPHRTPWIQVFGQAHAATNRLELKAQPSCTAGLWLAGSADHDPFIAELTFAVHSGALRILFLAAQDESQRWELRINAEGTVALHRIVDQYDRLIAVDRWTGTQHPITARLVKRHGQLKITLDGRELFNGWIAMHEHSPAGLMGVRVAGLESTASKAHIFSARIMPQETAVATWDAAHEKEAGILAWLQKHAAELTAVSPPLYRLQKQDHDHAFPSTLRLFRTAALINGWDLVPHLDIRSARDFGDWSPETVAAGVAGAGANGLLLRFDDDHSGEWQQKAEGIRTMSMALREHGSRLLLRLPELAANRMALTAAMGPIPGIQLVVKANEIPAPEQGKGPVEVRVPAPDPETDLRMYYDLLSIDRKRAVDEDHRARIQQWRDLAEERYAVGEYEDAIAVWFDWHEIEPANPFPLRRIGEALYRLGYREEAMEFYRQSLERDPGNIELAVSLIAWLDGAGRQEASRDMLRVYNLLFPDNPSLMLAQAEWLLRRDKRDECLVMVKKVLEKEPDNLTAVMLMAELGSTPAERRAAMEHLVQLGHTAEDRYRILQHIRNADLLVTPEADVLLELFDESYTKDDPRLTNLIADLMPRTEAASNVAVPGEIVPSGWRLESGITVPDPAHIRVRADAGREEAMLRLSGTERWHDVFVEADFARQTGEFWLVARRSRDHMIRFGFDSEGDALHLQVWLHKQGGLTLLRHKTRNWLLPAEVGARLRLEVRGTGAVGYIDGQPWGHEALELPEHFDPGWVGIAARTIEPGLAEMTLRKIAAGPLLPVLAKPEVTADGTRMDKQAEQLRGLTDIINAISPAVFSIDAEGVWSSKWSEQNDFHRLFARYHRLRLMPYVRVANIGTINAAILREAASIHDTDGFVLEMPQPPSATLTNALNRELADAGVFVFLSFKRNGIDKLMACGHGRLLLPGDITERDLITIEAQNLERAAFRDVSRYNPVFLRL